MMWRRIKVKLPEYYEDVLIWTKSMSMTAAYLVEDDDTWVIVDGKSCTNSLPLDEVIFWSSLPDPPSAVKNYSLTEEDLKGME